MLEQHIWNYVSHSPLESLWDLHGTPVRVLTRRAWNAIFADRLPGHAAELGFYFFFALFPMLFCASSFLGLIARSAHLIYDRLLDYLALVIPASALGAVLTTFNQTVSASTSGKITFGFLAAIWSASIGVSAIQDTLNDVYKITDSRPYLVARACAIGLTLLLMAIASVALAAILAGDSIAALAHHFISDRMLAGVAAIAARIVGRVIAFLLLALIFAIIYYWAPDLKKRRWHWFTPGALVGITGWLAASFGLRAYLYYFNNFSLTYGSLGAVIILLTWFYLSGLMLLVGAEFNSQIEASAARRHLAAGPISQPLAPETTQDLSRQKIS
ncbi:MAG TPA: YihY/virulence factor BrkB family protein [Terracidiphilus sp.]|nr:YihY/virulence factor BrkB family protein [Terracidiphilus sp.]